ncbi:GNAT family N-acetyltransferase [Streptomyces sp. NPDC056568]|uniref:GNAT family N-acetyltransferase n=1 Tax=Streptomyces sp. NPDC056568 TaxID=3345866 RepID=UPI0036C08B74
MILSRLPLTPDRDIPGPLLTELTALYASHRAFHALSGDFPDPDDIRPEQVAAALAEELARPDAEVLLARDAGRLVGCAVTLARHPDPADPDPWIGLLMVDAGLRRQGYGRRLASLVEDRFRADGRGAVRLAVLDGHTDALAFWTALGYTVVDHRPDLRRGRPCAVLRKLLDGPREPLDGPREPLDGPREPLDGAREPLDGAREPLDGSREPLDGPREPPAGVREPLDGPREPPAGVREPLEGPARTPRRAARVAVLDPEGAVFLFRYDNVEVGVHWAMPGGGLEADEGPREGALRELREETGWTDLEPGPLLCTWEHDFTHLSVGPVRQHEHVYVARGPRREPTGPGLAAAHAADGILTWRWWTRKELAGASEPLWPPDLARLLDAFDRSDASGD